MAENIKENLDEIKIVIGGSSHVEREKNFCVSSGKNVETMGLRENVNINWVGKGGLQIERVLSDPRKLEKEFMTEVQEVEAKLAIFIDGGNDLDKDTNHLNMSDEEHAVEVATSMIVVAKHAAPTAKQTYILSIIPRYKTRNISVDRFLTKMELCNETLNMLLDKKLREKLGITTILADLEGIEYWRIKGITYSESDLHRQDLIHLKHEGQKRLYHEIRKAICVGLENPQVWHIPRRA